MGSTPTIRYEVPAAAQNHGAIGKTLHDSRIERSALPVYNPMGPKSYRCCSHWAQVQSLLGGAAASVTQDRQI